MFRFHSQSTAKWGTHGDSLSQLGDWRGEVRSKDEKFYERHTQKREVPRMEYLPEKQSMRKLYGLT
jgi:hypothetical protein